MCPEARAITDEELESLLFDLESDRVERKAAFSDRDRVCQTICAFANDLPNHQQDGVLFIGANDDGTCASLPITDQLLLSLSHVRSDGNIIPFPVLKVQKKAIGGGDLAVVIVSPADSPPVRYKGQVWVRVGPRRATASPQEEKILSEKRRAGDTPFDISELRAASLGDLDTDWFEREYLPSAVAPDVLVRNSRETSDQLASLRFLSTGATPHPTAVGMLVVGKSPSDWIPGAYVQFLRVDGTELTAPIIDQAEVHGPVSQVIQRMEDLFRSNIRTATDVRTASTELRRPDYPLVALQQLARNAIMHRDYEVSHAPTRITWFSDRIELQNPGGPYGQVTVGNFGEPGITDYRNPNLAGALKDLGFVQRFGLGLELARQELRDNDNPDAEFHANESYVLVTVRARR